MQGLASLAQLTDMDMLDTAAQLKLAKPMKLAKRSRGARGLPA